jgi:hypothetical protein
VTTDPDEFDLAEAPAEGDGYYQAKTRQWVDLCPHMGPSDRTVLRILTDLTTHASNRRKLTLDQLRGVVTTNPVALGEDPKPISASGLLRILRNLAALGQITADEHGTPLTFSSRKNAQSRPVTMTIWRLPRHECGCHRNVFDALASVTKGEEPRYEPATIDDSAVRRRPKRAGQKSNPRRGAGQKSDSRGQKSNPGGQKPDPDSQGDQQEHAPPITPPTTLPSSSSRSAESAPAPRSPGDEEEEATAQENQKPPRQPRAVDLVREMTGATEVEAGAVLERVKAEAVRDNVRIRVLRRYVASFEPEDLTPHLDAVRAQRAAEARAAASETGGADTHCHTHREALPCAACKGSPRPVLVGLLRKYGATRRPDLAERLGELAGVR